MNMQAEVGQKKAKWIWDYASIPPLAAVSFLLGGAFFISPLMVETKSWTDGMVLWMFAGFFVCYTIAVARFRHRV